MIFQVTKNNNYVGDYSGSVPAIGSIITIKNKRYKINNYYLKTEKIENKEIKKNILEVN